MAMRGKWQRSSEQIIVQLLCVCVLIRGSFFFLPFPLSLPPLEECYSDEVSVSGRHLASATVISSSAHTKWPPTANTIKWQRIWRISTLLGSLKKKKKVVLKWSFNLSLHPKSSLYKFPWQNLISLCSKNNAETFHNNLTVVNIQTFLTLVVW